eukprot:CAMPEP_0181330834 /NCGR_PEP_ID=MMETSP1101-20121128/24142_1 /TAXON_ID=46948 /ORGANISM="Rhodomonas abbreviata, Strain Caron Lab Isolate" /LENGTH=163 /DNA_ID=CAMNT_0023440179 /DNA_START=29 /DNA_END=517 /DNA_ORIENTATION=-
MLPHALHPDITGPQRALQAAYDNTFMAFPGPIQCHALRADMRATEPVAFHHMGIGPWKCYSCHCANCVRPDNLTPLFCFKFLAPFIPPQVEDDLLGFRSQHLLQLRGYCHWQRRHRHHDFDDHVAECYLDLITGCQWLAWLPGPYTSLVPFVPTPSGPPSRPR